MARTPPQISRLFLIGSFLAISSSAGLQWAGLSAQSEAARQQASRETLTEFSSVLNRYETVPVQEKPAVAEHLTGMAERLSQQVKGESLASASRRVVALASFEDGKAARDTEIRDRLRAEVRGLASEAESLESAALGRAAVLSMINQVLLVGAAILFGMRIYQVRRTNSPA
jgi:hypothetical protein